MGRAVGGGSARAALDGVDAMLEVVDAAGDTDDAERAVQPVIQAVVDLRALGHPLGPTARSARELLATLPDRRGVAHLAARRGLGA